MVELNADWTSEGAQRAVERWLGGVASEESMPTTLVAQSDEMALGVRPALRDFQSQRGWPIGSAPSSAATAPRGSASDWFAKDA